MKYVADYGWKSTYKSDEDLYTVLFLMDGFYKLPRKLQIKMKKDHCRIKIFNSKGIEVDLLDYIK